MLKLLHAADLHLDSPLRGLARYEGAPDGEIRGATRGALENLVRLALDEEVGAVLLAGDVYDGDWNDYNTGLFFRRQMSRLGEAGIKVFLVSGNHDAASNISRQLALPQNVIVFSHHEAETSDRCADIGILVHGQGYAKRDVTENLAAGYPAPRSGLFNIGLLHTALDGAWKEHMPYAPCSKTQLIDHGYQYWALGHVHTRTEVAADPWIVFPGNLQGRFATETGPKGATLVTVDDSTLQVVSVEHRTLDTVRWEHLRIDASEVGAVHELDELVRKALADARAEAGDRLLAVRVSVTGTSPVHEELWRKRAQFTAEVRGLANDEFSRVWVEKVRPDTTAPGKSGGARSGPFGRPVGFGAPGAPDTAGTGGSAESADLAGLLDTVADLRRVAEGIKGDPDRLEALLSSAPLVDKIPLDVRKADQLPLDDPQWRERLFDNAVDQLLSLLDERAR